MSRYTVSLSLSAAALALCGSAFAQDTPGIPADAITLPSAAALNKAGLNEPTGGPRFDPALPNGTDDAYADLDTPKPVSDFVGALQRAYWTSPALLAERARLRSNDYRLPQARAASGPSLTFQASYGFLRDNQETTTAGWFSRSGWTSTAAAILNQPLFTFGRNGAGERDALGRIAFQRATLRTTESQTLYNAIRAYAGVLRDQSSLQIVRDDLALLEREYSENVARFASREVTSADVQQVESRLEQSRAQLLSTQRIAASSRAQFLSFIGAPASSELAPPNPLPMPVQTLEEAYAYADTHSAVLGAAYARERISRAQRDAAKSEMLPRVDLRGRASVGTVSPYSDALRTTELSGVVTVSGPIFQSGLLRSRVQEAEAANDADWRLIDGALRENRAEVADAWNDWLAQSASIEPLRRASEAARKSFEGGLLQEKAGFRTTLDVLQLARELLFARSSYNSATANAYVAQARLLSAMGVLEQSYLFPDAPRYDPDDHFDRTKDNGMVPVLVPIMRRVDGLFAGGRYDRPIRDPAAPLGQPSADIPVPISATEPGAEAEKTAP